MERMKDGDVIAFNGVVYKYCTGGTCLKCSLRNTRLCDHLKCFNGEHFEVLKGAEVIDMPSEEDAKKYSKHTVILGGYNWEEDEKEAYLDGFADCFYWLKSEIV